MEFNKLDFRILECSLPDGFGYLNNDRALELMDLGLLHPNPRENWTQNGYKATEKGKEQYNTWLKEIREKHGHIWMTNGDSEWRKDEEDSEYNRELDSFAYSEGYHNGYKCKVCGFEFCHHCNDESDLPECSEKTKGQTMSDDSNLDRGMIAMSNSMVGR